MSLGTGTLPQRVPLSTNRAFPGLDPLGGQTQGLDPNASVDDVASFINNGGFSQALQSGSASDRATMKAMLQSIAQRASQDQSQLDQLGQRLGLGNGTATAQAVNPQTGSATAQAFNPLANNQLAAPSRLTNGIGPIGSDNNVDQQLSDLSALGGGGGFFEDKVFAIMCQVVQQYQKQIEDRLNNLQQQAQDAQGQTQQGGQDSGSESRNIEFEKIKYDMQKLSQMQQAMSNVLDSMNDLAQNAIRKIKGTG